MKKSVFISVFTIIPVVLSSFNIGYKFEIAGGPLTYLTANIPLTIDFDLNISAGGFPEIILRADINLRWQRQKKWFPYLQTGSAFIRFYRGKNKHKNLIDIHLVTGIVDLKLSKIQITPHFGILYIPDFINPDFENSASGLAIVPMLGFEVFLKGK